MPNRRCLTVIPLLATGLLVSLAAQAPAASSRAGENITGTVLNMTTGAAVANAPVTLVLLQGSMQPVATTSADPQGHYRFSQTQSGPYMVETDHQGVSYFAQVTAGQSETNLDVYDVARDAKLMDVDAEIMVLQPDQGQLAVVNEYRIENALRPLRTLAQKGGMFRFRVPAGAHVDMVHVDAPNEQPLVRPALPTADHDVYAVDTPLRPGETRIEVSYRIPYPGLKATVAEQPVTVPAHFEVYVPGPMTFQGSGFTQVGAQQGYRVYGIAQGPVAATETFAVSGDAPLPAAATSAAPSGAASSAANAGDSGAASAESSAAPADPSGPVPTPTWLERNRWTLLAALVLAAAAGLGLMLSRPETAPAAPGTPPPLPLPASTASPDRLASLKDDLFLLEVRRHTGNISESEYARLRAELNARLDRLRQADPPTS